jgi:superfamily II DNA/RNA helicase
MKKIKLFHNFIPIKHRLMTLLGFAHTHQKDSVVVLCAGENSAEFLKIIMNLFEISSGSISTKQTPQLQEETFS